MPDHYEDNMSILVPKVPDQPKVERLTFYQNGDCTTVDVPESNRYNISRISNLHDGFTIAGDIHQFGSNGKVCIYLSQGTHTIRWIAKTDQLLCPGCRRKALTGDLCTSCDEGGPSFNSSIYDGMPRW